MRAEPLSVVAAPLRPPGTFGDWLEGLIDPAVKELRQRGDAELENVAMARAAAGVDTPPRSRTPTESEPTGRQTDEGSRR